MQFSVLFDPYALVCRIGMRRARHGFCAPRRFTAPTFFLSLRRQKAGTFPVSSLRLRAAACHHGTCLPPPPPPRPPPRPPFFGEVPRKLATPSHYAYLKIAEGCRKRCAFCVIPEIKGPLRSKPRARVLREARALRAAGVREIVLVAQASAVSSYACMRFPPFRRPPSVCSSRRRASRRRARASVSSSTPAQRFDALVSTGVCQTERAPRESRRTSATTARTRRAARARTSSRCCVRCSRTTTTTARAARGASGTCDCSTSTRTRYHRSGSWDPSYARDASTTRVVPSSARVCWVCRAPRARCVLRISRCVAQFAVFRAARGARPRVRASRGLRETAREVEDACARAKGVVCRRTAAPPLPLPRFRA